jgi:hypothetical protein
MGIFKEQSISLIIIKTENPVSSDTHKKKNKERFS